MPATVSENNTRVTFTIDKKMKEQAEKQAKKEKRSLSNMIIVALEEYLDNIQQIRSTTSIPTKLALREAAFANKLLIIAYLEAKNQK